MLSSNLRKSLADQQKGADRRPSPYTIPVTGQKHMPRLENPAVERDREPDGPDGFLLRASLGTRYSGDSNRYSGVFTAALECAERHFSGGFRADRAVFRQRPFRN